MKITESYLKQLIKEELKLRVKEGRFGKQKQPAYLQKAQDEEDDALFGKSKGEYEDVYTSDPHSKKAREKRSDDDAKPDVKEAWRGSKRTNINGGSYSRSDETQQVLYDLENAIDQHAEQYFKSREKVLTQKGINLEQLRQILNSLKDKWFAEYRKSQKASSRSYDDYQDMPVIPQMAPRLHAVAQMARLHIPGFDVNNNEPKTGYES
jgi:hypothetical protein